jgi:hypothetical protein
VAQHSRRWYLQVIKYLPDGSANTGMAYSVINIPYIWLFYRPYINERCWFLKTFMIKFEKPLQDITTLSIISQHSWQNFAMKIRGRYMTHKVKESCPWYLTKHHAI